MIMAHARDIPSGDESYSGQNSSESLSRHSFQSTNDIASISNSNSEFDQNRQRHSSSPSIGSQRKYSDNCRQKCSTPQHTNSFSQTSPGTNSHEISSDAQMPSRIHQTTSENPRIGNIKSDEDSHNFSGTRSSDENLPEANDLESCSEHPQQKVNLSFKNEKCAFALKSITSEAGLKEIVEFLKSSETNGDAERSTEKSSSNETNNHNTQNPNTYATSTTHLDQDLPSTSGPTNFSNPYNENNQRTNINSTEESCPNRSLTEGVSGDTRLPQRRTSVKRTKTSQLKRNRRKKKRKASGFSQSQTPGLWKANKNTTGIMDSSKFGLFLTHVRKKQHPGEIVYKFAKDFDEVIRKIKEVLDYFYNRNLNRNNDNCEAKILKGLKKRLQKHKNCEKCAR